MRSVAVVGGGAAGVAAALEAASLGADVTVFEAGASLPPSRRSWLDLLDGKRGPQRSAEGPLLASGVSLRKGFPVASVTAEGKVEAGGHVRFDAVVLATGSRPADTKAFPAKRGTHTLGSERAFAELGAALRGAGGVCIAGSGPLSLLVAEKALARSTPTTLLSAHPLSSLFDADCAAAVLGAAVSAGLLIVPDEPERLVGAESVEAVVSAGRVYPCDTFAVVPGFLPSPVRAPAARGHGGGVLVDLRMRSSCPRLFAAGDCAEFSDESSPAFLMCEPSARLTGTVAGSGAAGIEVSARPVGVFSARLFGIEASCTGLNLEAARASHREAVNATGSVGGFTCTLVFETRGLRLLGVQMAGPSAEELAAVASLAVAEGLTLRELAYMEAPNSTDITALCDTARRELRRRLG